MFMSVKSKQLHLRASKRIAVAPNLLTAGIDILIQTSNIMKS